MPQRPLCLTHTPTHTTLIMYSFATNNQHSSLCEKPLQAAEVYQRRQSMLVLLEIKQIFASKVALDIKTGKQEQHQQQKQQQEQATGS